MKTRVRETKTTYRSNLSDDMFEPAEISRGVSNVITAWANAYSKLVVGSSRILVQVMNEALDQVDELFVQKSSNGQSSQCATEEGVSSRTHQEHVFESDGQRVTERFDRVQESAPRRSNVRQVRESVDDVLDREVQDAIDRLGKALAARALRESATQIREESAEKREKRSEE
ncbi:MAG: hypothetical protein JWN70_1476 [Planctomycetaceae bacterium]|nr:hypothetical protein [Planctomycetaceae bacterium]